MKQRFIRIASSVAAVLLLAVGLIWLCHADPIEAFGYFCYGLFGCLCVCRYSFLLSFIFQFKNADQKKNQGQEKHTEPFIRIQVAFGT